MIFVIAFIVVFFPVILFHPTKFLHKENLPKRGKKAIITCNHYSNWDAFIIDVCLFRKFRFLAKKELFENKFMGFLYGQLAAIPVDRENVAPSTFKKVLTELKKDKQIFIFPEGTRNKQGTKTLGEIKSGFLTFASKGECDITPMLFYRKAKFFRRNYVIIGKPFKLEGENPKRLTKEELEMNLERYLNVLADLRKELDGYVEGKKNRKKSKK